MPQERFLSRGVWVQLEARVQARQFSTALSCQGPDLSSEQKQVRPLNTSSSELNSSYMDIVGLLSHRGEVNGVNKEFAMALACAT